MAERTMANFHRTETASSTVDSVVSSTVTSNIIATKRYNDYYDVSDTITVAGATNPNDFDSQVYNRERVFVDKGRNAERLLVKNDGEDILYCVVSHLGELAMSAEVPVYPEESKIYYNVYELRLRSPTAGNAYRVTEYELLIGSAATSSTTLTMPTTVLVGTKTGITTIASQIVVASTPIEKVVTVKVRSLGTGTYIALGNVATQSFRLQSVGAAINIDWINNLNKVYVITDAGATGSIEYIGG